MRHDDAHQIHIFKDKCPAEVWSWLMGVLGLEHCALRVVWLVPDSEVAVEYFQRMRNY